MRIVHCNCTVALIYRTADYSTHVEERLIAHLTNGYGRAALLELTFDPFHWLGLKVLSLLRDVMDLFAFHEMLILFLLTSLSVSKMTTVIATCEPDLMHQLPPTKDLTVYWLYFLFSSSSYKTPIRTEDRS